MTELIDFKKHDQDEWTVVEIPLEIRITNEVLRFFQDQEYLSIAKIRRIKDIMSNTEVSDQTFHEEVSRVIGEDVTSVQRAIFGAVVMPVQFRR